MREVAFSPDYIGLPLDQTAALAVTVVAAVLGPLAVLLDQHIALVAGCAIAAVLAALYLLISRRGRLSPRHAHRRGGIRMTSPPGAAAAAAPPTSGGGGPSPLP